ncbi:unnamed protein product [Brassica oleracea var. botrytis]
MWDENLKKYIDDLKDPSLSGKPYVLGKTSLLISIQMNIDFNFGIDHMVKSHFVSSKGPKQSQHFMNFFFQKVCYHKNYFTSVNNISFVAILLYTRGWSALRTSEFTIKLFNIPIYLIL